MAFAIIGGSLAVVGTAAGLIQGGKAKKAASSAQRAANNNFKRQESAYKSFQFENKFGGLQNTAAGAQKFSKLAAKF